jgi:hypothetical protein
MIAVPSVREVLKEGKIVKISARTGDHQDRYLFLVRGFWILNFHPYHTVKKVNDFTVPSRDVTFLQE